ncbi:MAG: NFACT family protein, partial [Fervidobacterium sp.]
KPKISEFLYSSLQGFSKITAEEVLFRADLEDSAVSEMDESMITSLWNALDTIKLELASSYSFIYYEDNEPVDISAIRLHVYSDEKRCDNVLACINEYFTFVEKKEKRLQKKNQLSSVVKAKIDVYETLLKKLNEEFDECKELDRYRKYGELIKAYAYQIQSGNEKVTLLDWETNEVVQVPLEKNLSPIENSVRYFNMYSKLKRKASGLKERIEIVSRELDYLQQLLMTIESAEDLEDLKEIEEEMVENELIKVRKSKGKLQTSREFVSQPRKYVYNGFTIYVGKNNRQNDELVRKASDNDLWFHVQGMPGAHVLIKTGGKHVDEDTLRYAATLAATYSKGKYSSNVPVDYTQIKYVKKPRGFKPGLVLYSNFKTIFADPIDHSAE